MAGCLTVRSVAGFCEPVAGFPVVFRDSSHAVIERVLTDGNGVATICGMKDGEIIVEVAGPGVSGRIFPTSVIYNQKTGTYHQFSLVKPSKHTMYLAELDVEIVLKGSAPDRTLVFSTSGKCSFRGFLENRCCEIFASKDSATGNYLADGCGNTRKVMCEKGSDVGGRSPR